MLLVCSLAERGTLAPASTETGREQWTPELWSGNSLDAAGHEMTAKRSLGSCLVGRKKALVTLSFRGVFLAPSLPPVTLYLTLPCPQTQIHISQQRHSGGICSEEAGVQGTGGLGSRSASALAGCVTSGVFPKLSGTFFTRV